MLLLPLLPPLPSLLVTLIDAGILALVMFPLAFLLLFRPMARRIEALDHERVLTWRSHERVRAQMAAYRTVFERAPSAVLLIDPVTALPVEFNETACRQLGYTRTEFSRIRITDYEAAETSEETRRHIARILREGRDEFSTRHRTKDGKLLDVLVTAWTVELSGRTLFHCVFRDNSERKRAESALKASEEKYRTLYESSRDAIMTLFPPDWRFASGNPATVAMFGAASEEDFTSRAPWEFSPERQPDGELSSEKAKRMIETAMEKGSHFFEWTHTMIDGRDFPATVLLTRYELAGRAGLQATVRDISGMKRAEEELSRLSQALSQSPVLAIITDTEGNIEFVNPKFTQVTGYAPQEVRGRNPRILKSGKTPLKAHKTLWNTISAGKEWTGEFQNKRKDGSLFHVRASIAPLRGASGAITGYLALEEDITSHKELEDSLRQAQKMESVGRLAGGVAHDFNNLLTVINGLAQFLLDGFSPEDPRHQDAQEILTAGTRAGTLTRQLLAFSRKQVLSPQVMDLNLAVAGTLRMLRRLIGEDVLVKTCLASRPSMVRVDAGQIDQVLMNLAVNARDAMPKGGALSIGTQVLALEETSPSVQASLRRGPVVCLSVRDNGTGMREEVRKRVFEPFFTTKAQGKGTGLGLAMVYGIVKQSGGDIEVESSPDKGTVFRIYFPYTDAGPQENNRNQEKGSPHGTETILLVEDEDLVRRLAERILREQGYTVLTAPGGTEALRALQERGTPVDLLITDVMMPGMSGRDLAKEIGRNALAGRTLFMSDHTDDAIMRHGVLEPGLAFLCKPFTPETLSSRAREVLDGSAENARS